MAKAKKKESEPEIPQAPELDPRTLVGNIRDFLLDRLKHDKESKPWAQMTEAEQGDAIAATTSAAENLVRNAVDLISTQGFSNAKAEIDAWKVKGKQIVITLKSFASEENVLSLLNAGNVVTMTFANDEQFDQGRADCKPDPDQHELAVNDQEAAEDEE